MKRLILAALVLSAGFLALRSFQAIPADAGEGRGGVVIENGDCDGSGSRELTDAVYLLNWLFLGGPSPVPIEAPEPPSAPPPPVDILCVQESGGIKIAWDNPVAYDSIEIRKDGASVATLMARETEFLDPLLEPGQTFQYSVRGKLGGVVSPSSSCSVSIPSPQPQRVGLVATGVKECWGRAGPLECDVPPARGQDGFYRKGCPPEDRFVDNQDGTVTDRCTGLMWSKKYIDVNGDFEISGPDHLQWLDAVQFVEDMTYADHSDWRLPNIQELLSIRDFGRSSGSTLFYPPFAFDQTWSSTTRVESTGSAWYIQPLSECNAPIAYAKPKDQVGVLVAVRDAE